MFRVPVMACLAVVLIASAFGCDQSGSKGGNRLSPPQYQGFGQRPNAKNQLESDVLQFQWNQVDRQHKRNGWMEDIGQDVLQGLIFGQ